jgi:AcrR family transcriptional regulator
MSGPDFDQALIAAAFQRAAELGWTRLTIVDAARAAGLSVAEARARFPGKLALLLRFGVLLDQAALAAAPSDGPARDRLFDLVMSRFDAMKPHRSGLRALLRHLPGDPPLALLLGCATRRSMRWMLQAAGISTAGLRGGLRVRGMVAVWLWSLRAFEGDASEDLAPTMAALDTALRRVHAAGSWLGGPHESTPAEPDEDASMAGDAGEADETAG